MSATTRREHRTRLERPTWLDRIAGFAVFELYYTLALFMVAPVLLVGAIFSAVAVVSSGAGDWDPFLAALALAAPAGILGLVGIRRHRSHGPGAPRSAVETTTLLLAVGLVAASVPAVLIAYHAIAGTFEEGAGSWLLTFAAALLPIIVTTLAALGRMSRLQRLDGRTILDPVPVLFLLLSLGLGVVVLLAATALD